MEVLIPVAIVVLVPLAWLIATYNGFARLRNHLRESWADIDVEMKRRYDLIPNLVETVRGYAQHEQAVFREISELRTRAYSNQGTAAEQAVDETALMIGMKRLFAIAEAYPQLKADTQFLALQHELANTEDRIAASRRFYNGNVRELNMLCDQFPSSIVAGLFGFTRADYFELASDAERVVPRVDVAAVTR